MSDSWLAALEAVEIDEDLIEVFGADDHVWESSQIGIGVTEVRSIRVTRPGDAFQKMVTAKRGRHRVRSASAKYLKNDSRLNRL
jgi:hypothetical protein